MRGAAYDHVLVLAERLAHEIAEIHVVGLDADCKIDTALLQVLDQISMEAVQHVDVNQRAGALQVEHGARHEAARCARSGAEAHDAGLGFQQARQFRAQRAHFAFDRAAVLEQKLAKGRRRGELGVAIEQVHAKLLLQSMDRLAQRLLSAAQLAGRAREAAMLDDRQEIAQLAQFHRGVSGRVSVIIGVPGRLQRAPMR